MSQDPTDVPTPPTPEAPNDEGVGMDPSVQAAGEGAIPSTPVPDAADPMKSEKAWVVSPGLKALFFFSAIAMMAGLIGYKAYERVRYEAILVETVMDPVPVSGQAPTFTLTDGEGSNRVDLAELKGKYVFVNFWATWCPPCREEMPSLEYLTRKYGDRMAFLAVSVDEDWNEVRRFFGSDAPTFKLLWDPRRTATRQYGTEKFPESYLIGPDGKLVAKFVGPRDWNNQASEEYFRKLLGG